MEVFRHLHYIRGFTYMDPQRLPAITHCGEATYSQTHQSPVHTHPGFEFIFLSSGTATRYEGSHQTRHKMGEIYIAYPNEKHEVHCQQEEEGHQLWIGLRLEKLGREGAALSRCLRDRKPRPLPNCQSVETVLQGIIRQVIADRPLRREIIGAQLRLAAARQALAPKKS